MTDLPQHIKDLCLEAARLRETMNAQAVMNTPTDPLERYKSRAEYERVCHRFIHADRAATDAMVEWRNSLPNTTPLPVDKETA